MNYKINDKIISDCKFVMVQGHARINAESMVQSELFKQKYGEYPQLVDIWDMDKDIIEASEMIVDRVFNCLYQS